MNAKHPLVIASAIIVLCLSIIGYNTAPVQATGVLYVAPIAVGSGDCSSWANACTLQTALTNAVAGQQIWVQAGVYKPGSTRSDSFALKSNVAVYGGFAGIETSLSQRNITNITVLSGDIDNNDSIDANGVTTEINGANSYHVVTASGVTGAVLDGFVITGGQADGGVFFDKGGGLYSYNSSFSLRHITFAGNYASSGGGMYNDHSLCGLELETVTFMDNTALYFGGGMFNEQISTICTTTNPTLKNVTFANNRADYGGGMFNSNSSPEIIHVTFSGNHADQKGGGMYNNSGSNPEVRRVIIWGNSAQAHAGVSNVSGATPRFTHTIVEGCINPISLNWINACGINNGGNLGADPNLGPLTDFGGPGRQLFPLSPGSPAIDAVTGYCPSVSDQRGVARPVDGDGDSVARCDIGAFEFTASVPTPT
ncbi:choice-of-anchor Q domain-containing protein, partial [Chloroflexus sp.]